MMRRSVEDGVCCRFGDDDDGKGEGDVGCRISRRAGWSKGRPVRCSFVHD